MPSRVATRSSRTTGPRAPFCSRAVVRSLHALSAPIKPVESVAMPRSYAAPKDRWRNRGGSEDHEVRLSISYISRNQYLRAYILVGAQLCGAYTAPDEFSHRLVGFNS